MIPNLGSAAKPTQVWNPPLTQIALPETPEVYQNIFNQMENQVPQSQNLTIEQPIVDQVANAPMKSIPLQSIPTFYGMITEDLDAFLFKFYFLYRGCDYTTDPQKLKLLPSTLKGVVLRWFMGLGRHTINSWDDMKNSFLTRYQDFCKTRELKDEIFKMVAKYNETLEEYVEWFHYNLQRSPHTTLSKEVLQAILIKGMKV